uniref:WRKY transcription factor n=1 Tax=Fagopyrum tataricum TaxID=62330 RepID=A0A4P9Q285_FAGTA|nr:WRKY transcription factor [Fagopyrum tataricum]
MEINNYSQFEQSYLINELSQGMELARQLRDQMGPEHSIQAKEMLLQQIVSSYDKALFILGCGADAEQPHQLMPVHSPAMPSSPSSIVESPYGNDLNTRSNGLQDGSLKRKSASTWTKQVKMNPENGLDGPPDDGYSWRKYGQKDILGAKNPRSYYRCTYRNTQKCWATRQVQRSEKDDTVFDITYRENHTCTMVRRSKSAPTSPGKQQEPKQEDFISAEYQQDSAMVMSFQTAPSQNNADIHNMDGFNSMALVSLESASPTYSTSTLNNSGLYGNLSTSLISPSTSSSNYFSMEADLADMMLAATSSTNSSTIPDFSLDSWNFNQELSFNDPGFFYEQKGSF